MRGWDSRCGAPMSLSISKLIDVSCERLPIPAALLASLLLLNSSSFPGWVPNSLDSGLTKKGGQLRTSDNVVAAIIRLSVQKEPANSATHFAFHVPSYFLSNPGRGQESPPPPGQAEEPSPPPHCLCSNRLRGAWDLGPITADSAHEK